MSELEKSVWNALEESRKDFNKEVDLRGRSSTARQLQILSIDLEKCFAWAQFLSRPAEPQSTIYRSTPL